MKTKRNLSGIYIRTEREGVFDNIVFEDLTEQEQDKVLDNWTDTQIKSLAKQLANTVNKIGETFDIVLGEN